MYVDLDKELIYLNALNNLSAVGTRRITALVEFFGSAETAWRAPEKEIEMVSGIEGLAEKIYKEKKNIDPEQKWQELCVSGISCISTASPAYPTLLKQVVNPPAILYYIGSLKQITQPAVAIVGSRRCTFYGKEVAHKLAAELAASNITVVSGMALGIDTAAHKGALENSGYTAAVLGCGLDQCYPRSNQDLMQEIATHGVVFSEFPYGAKPLPGNFPQRNRIISGLTLGTVVVEATAKSGSLITANFAVEQNREVFAVPGNVGSPYSRGSHHLIKEGAKLVETVDDILSELYLNREVDEQLSIEPIRPKLGDVEKKLLAIIPYQPIHIDDLVRISLASPAEVSTLLLSLELKKYIRQTPGKYFCRI
ncbi:MAG: DNA-processing protein DprA [Bacillota bacterium]|nr:DNA-processing protein DprA [Bacillota bacterium]